MASPPPSNLPAFPSRARYSQETSDSGFEGNRRSMARRYLLCQALMPQDREEWGQALVGAGVPAGVEGAEARAGMRAAGWAAALLAGGSGVPVGEDLVPAGDLAPGDWALSKPPRPRPLEFRRMKSRISEKKRTISRENSRPSGNASRHWKVVCNSLDDQTRSPFLLRGAGPGRE